MTASGLPWKKTSSYTAPFLALSSWTSHTSTGVAPRCENSLATREKCGSRREISTLNLTSSVHSAKGYTAFFVDGTNSTSRNAKFGLPEQQKSSQNYHHLLPHPLKMKYSLWRHQNVSAQYYGCAISPPPIRPCRSRWSGHQHGGGPSPNCLWKQ